MRDLFIEQTYTAGTNFDEINFVSSQGVRAGESIILKSCKFQAANVTNSVTHLNLLLQDLPSGASANQSFIRHKNKYGIPLMVGPEHNGDNVFTWNTDGIPLMKFSADVPALDFKLKFERFDHESPQLLSVGIWCKIL